MKLNSEQINIIRQVVDSAGIKIESLRDDVLDHLCCVIENDLAKGNTFEKLLPKAITRKIQ